MDSTGIWGIFKPHGKVRDVFLSVKNNDQRNAYAFIRFETKEEANRVVRKVDGMHTLAGEGEEPENRDRFTGKWRVGITTRLETEGVEIMGDIIQTMRLEPHSVKDLKAVQEKERVDSLSNKKTCKFSSSMINIGDKFLGEVRTEFKRPGRLTKQGMTEAEDFNTILDPSKRIGGESNMISVRRFNSFVLHVKMVDIPLVGILFTWCNHRERASMARLDRFLLSPEILSWFPKLVQRDLEWSFSNHNMIIIGEPKHDWGLCLLRFYNDWLDDKEVMREATKGWTECKVNGSRGLDISTKLKAIKRSIKS
ncbi:hypothetical protein Ddye_024702 [Dipteronia dyeriana]|uniref:RRM domain-containing protein n=1 Tax=Dipteronia dyeriana TaxID=168575 RepID=A0AAD9TVD1_9ROSI|nr:hypothetical protein Ddye_024702 [Dipteronia dyeriana]